MARTLRLLICGNRKGGGTGMIGGMKTMVLFLVHMTGALKRVSMEGHRRLLPADGYFIRAGSALISADRSKTSSTDRRLLILIRSALIRAGRRQGKTLTRADPRFSSLIRAIISRMLGADSH